MARQGLDVKVFINFQPLRDFQDHLSRFRKEMPLAQTRSMEELGPLMVQRVREASGRAGIRVVTGNYLAAFDYVRTGGDGVDSVMVVNPSPQTMRLEKGFYGMDALGRVYHQPARPHISVGVATAAAEWKKGYRQLPRRVWRETK